MSDHIEGAGAGIKVIRAAFSAALSKREQIDIARENAVQSVDLPKKIFLSFVRYFPMGYPMGDDLVPIAEMYSGSSDSSENTIEYMERLNEAEANLYNKLNISPDLEPFVSPGGGYPILNQVYKTFLDESEFAGEVSSNSEESKEAYDFLFTKNENEMPERSDAYKQYKDYKDKCVELEKKISEAIHSDPPLDVASLNSSLQVAKADWITLGEKRKVEKALNILIRSDADAGYDDERNAFIESLESKLRIRLSSSTDDYARYAPITISPLKPLLDPTENAPLWQRFSLTVEDIELYLTPDICQIFDILPKELSYVLKNFKSASMQYIRVFLDREWLRQDFLTARYWKNKESLSDGSGHGKLPTFISSAFYIKSAMFEMYEGINVYEGDINAQNIQVKEVFAYEVVDTPLIKAFIQKNMAKPLDTENKLISEEAISNLKKIDFLQSQEKSRRTKAEKIHLPPTSLKTRLSPDISHEKTSQLGRVATRLQVNPEVMQSQEKLKHKEAEKMVLRSEMLQAEFKPVIGDHRSSIRQLAGVKTRPQVNPIVNDHRSNTTIVNDHRSNTMIGTGVWHRPDRVIIINDSKQMKKLNISGKIKHNNILDETDLNIELIFLNKNNNELKTEDIQLSRQGSNIVFSINAISTDHITRVEQSIAQSIIINLTDKEGDNLIEKRIEFIDNSKDITLDWNVSRDSAIVRLSDPVSLTLFAYSLQLMPKAPNPDESMFNS